MDIIRTPGYLANADGSISATIKHVHQGFAGNAALTATIPVTDASGGLASALTAAPATSQVVKAAPCNLYGLNVTPTAAGYAMLFDSPTVPADGAVAPRRAWAMQGNTTLELEFSPPLRMNNGAVLVFSSTGPFTKTTNSGATAFLSGEAQ